MATLVLTVVGGLVGGPVGAAVGGAIGGAIDREVLFKPAGREGPRLSELKVQTSSYGTQIPKVFGTMRVAGSVIWAADLVEHRSTSGGKGQPKTTTYSYTASFAVALSGRPILGVGRIWADGTLLRGSAGDFKVASGFRLHLGSEDQARDPLIASAEGLAVTPAHRGVAYAVFEDLELGDFGNRIPSLTFEVIADAAPVTPAGVAVEIAEGLAGDALTPALDGFSAYGDSVRAVAETLAGAAGGWFAPRGDGLWLTSGGGELVAVEDAGAAAEGSRPVRGNRSIAAADSAPRALSLTHYDPARDYQIGVQRAVRPGAGAREARLELPAALDAGAAKTVAERALARLDVERERRSLTLGWEALAIAPGARVAIDGIAGSWRVEKWGLEAMVVTLDCVALAPTTLPASASGGRVLGAPDLTIGRTVVHAFELPPLDDTLAAAPRLAIAAAGEGAGWRSAALSLSLDGGASWRDLGGTARPAVLGWVRTPPGPATTLLADRIDACEVELATEAMLLNDADAAALDAGANLAILGDELVQFARVEPIGGARWRLSGLWRGRRGTEAAVGNQTPGDRFVLLQNDALVSVDLPLGMVGGEIQVLATGAGDAGTPAEAKAAVSGLSVVPPSPVGLSALTDFDGTTALAWTRRSRLGWRWVDGVDAPLGEEVERYRVTIAPEGGATRAEECGVPAFTLAATDRSNACRVEVRQIGALGLSPPATLLLSPIGGS